jgi:hypothetical protein
MGTPTLETKSHPEHTGWLFVLCKEVAILDDFIFYGYHAQ